MVGDVPASGAGEQTLDRIHHVIDAAHRLELVRLYLLAGQLLQVHHQIDGIYAVELEILIEACLGSDGLFIDFEQLDEGGFDLGKDVVTGHGSGLPFRLGLHQGDQGCD